MLLSRSKREPPPRGQRFIGGISPTPWLLRATRANQTPCLSARLYSRTAQNPRNAFGSRPKRFVNAIEFHEHFIADINCCVKSVAFRLQLLDARSACHHRLHIVRTRPSPLLLRRAGNRHIDHRTNRPRTIRRTPDTCSTCRRREGNVQTCTNHQCNTYRPLGNRSWSHLTKNWT